MKKITHDILYVLCCLIWFALGIMIGIKKDNGRTYKYICHAVEPYSTQLFVHASLYTNGENAYAGCRLSLEKDGKEDYIIRSLDRIL